MIAHAVVERRRLKGARRFVRWTDDAHRHDRAVGILRTGRCWREDEFWMVSDGSPDRQLCAVATKYLTTAFFDLY